MNNIYRFEYKGPGGYSLKSFYVVAESYTDAVNKIKMDSSKIETIIKLNNEDQEVIC